MIDRDKIKPGLKALYFTINLPHSITIIINEILEVLKTSDSQTTAGQINVKCNEYYVKLYKSRKAKVDIQKSIVMTMSDIMYQRDELKSSNMREIIKSIFSIME